MTSMAQTLASLSLCHVYIRTRHSSAHSKLSFILILYFLSLSLLLFAHTALSGYISADNSLAWFSDRVVIIHIYI